MGIQDKARQLINNELGLLKPQRDGGRSVVQQRTGAGTRRQEGTKIVARVRIVVVADQTDGDSGRG